MKKLLSFTTLFGTFSLSLGRDDDELNTAHHPDSHAGNSKAINHKKYLIVVFSHGGHTLKIAGLIKKHTGGSIFELKSVSPYPADEKKCMIQAKKEIADNFLPELVAMPRALKTFDVIFVGSPNWENSIAPPLSTFLSKANLSGKIVVPFITHNGSGAGHAGNDIAKLCKNASIYEVQAFHEGECDKAVDKIDRLIKILEKKEKPHKAEKKA